MRSSTPSWRNANQMGKSKVELFRISEKWLGGRDSNPDSTVQSRVSYHWTTPQQVGSAKVKDRPAGRQGAVRERRDGFEQDPRARAPGR